MSVKLLRNSLIWLLIGSILMSQWSLFLVGNSNFVQCLPITPTTETAKKGWKKYLMLEKMIPRSNNKKKTKFNKSFQEQNLEKGSAKFENNADSSTDYTIKYKKKFYKRWYFATSIVGILSIVTATTLYYTTTPYNFGLSSDAKKSWHDQIISLYQSMPHKSGTLSPLSELYHQHQNFDKQNLCTSERNCTFLLTEPSINMISHPVDRVMFYLLVSLLLLHIFYGVLYLMWSCGGKEQNRCFRCIRQLYFRYKGQGSSSDEINQQEQENNEKFPPHLDFYHSKFQIMDNKKSATLKMSHSRSKKTTTATNNSKSKNSISTTNNNNNKVSDQNLSNSISMSNNVSKTATTTKTPKGNKSKKPRTKTKRLKQ